MKRCFDPQRLVGLDVKQNLGALLANGNKESLPHGESVASIEDRAGLGPDGKGSCKRFRRQHLDLSVELQVKFPENLEWIHPRLHAAGFISEQASAHSSCGQAFPQTHGTA